MARQLRKRSEAGGGDTLADQLAASVRSRTETIGTPQGTPTDTAGSGTRVPLGEVSAGARAVPAEYLAAEKPVLPPRPAPGAPFGPPAEKKPEPPPLYQKANADGTVGADFERIVETVYAADAFRDYEELEAHLEVGEERGDYGTLREHLDKAERRARRAHKLYLGSKLELVKWEQDSRKVTAGMRREATEALQADAERTKRITNDDVEAKMLDLFPDEVQAQEIRRAKLKGVVEDLEHLTRRWDAKCSDLRTLIETLRK